MAAPVDVTVELFIDDAWEDITSYARSVSPTEIRFGVAREGTVADPATCTLIVNNRDGRFTPRNTSGAYYPFLTRNTPLRVSVGSAVRFVGAVSEFPVRWEPAEADVWVPLEAAGPLRRLARANVLDSTVRSALMSYVNQSVNPNLKGYWPVEDVTGSTQIANAFSSSNYPPGVITLGTPVFEGLDPGVMSKPVATWENAGATFIPRASSSAEFLAGFLLTLPATGELSGGEELFSLVTGGTARDWNILYSPGSGGRLLLQIVSGTGVELYAATHFSGMDGGTWYVQLTAESGGNVDWDLFLFSTTSPTPTISSDTLPAQTITGPTQATIGMGVIAIGAPVGIGHVALADSDLTLGSKGLGSAMLAYAGESIRDRLVRLESQTGQNITATLAPDEYVEMGIQIDGSLLDVLRSAEAADVGGILHDSLDTVNTLHYIERMARYNDQQPSLTLDCSAGHISAVAPTDDDANLINDVTVERLGGSSARRTLDSGALSTADYPDGVGRYASGVTLATYEDSELGYVADWLLALGTIDETRWPQLTIDLVRNPSLVSAFDDLRPGAPVLLENLPAFAGVSDVALHCVGWTEVLTSHTRLVTLNCVPGTIWGASGTDGGIFELNDAVFGELDVNRLAY